jgi:hypothetical protein
MFDHFDKCDICLATIQNDVCVGNAVRMYLRGVKETELEHRRCEWQSGKTLHKQRVVHLNRHGITKNLPDERAALAYIGPGEGPLPGTGSLYREGCPPEGVLTSPAG